MNIDIPILGFGKSGGYRVISRLATEWTRKGHAVRILACRASTEPYFPTEAQIVWLNDHGEQVPANAPELIRHRSGPISVARNLYILLLGLSRYSGSSDVIVANHSLTAWPTLACISKARKIYYIQAYEADFYSLSADGRRPLLQLQAWLSYFLPLRRISNAPLYLNYKNLRSNLWVPPGVDFSLFRPTQRPNRQHKSIVTLACIGRKEPDKGTRYALEAFALLKSSLQGVRLLVAYGNIPANFGKMEGIEVVVPSNDAELADFYRRADIFIAAAIGQHGAPHYPVMEAMACGIPLITTGYLPSSPENCWLVPERDPVAIAGAVHCILSNPLDRERRVQTAFADIAAFSWDAVSTKMLHLGFLS
jgi:glycosyltransferase involved in cell wall biosynthesis